jgi:iron complex outermembrane receptor protein
MLRARFHLSSSIGALALSFLGSPAFAQPPANGAPAENAQESQASAGPSTITQAEGEIIVTGSRISGAAPVGSSVIAVGRDDVIASGAVTTDRILKQIPQVFDLGVSENSRGQSGGNGNITYGNSINLRGIGPYATLILVDGHRAVNNSRAFDPSVIPTLGLERIEVVADGASAIYGSDAVAGVVNLIPRRSLDGVEMSARHGFDERGDYEETQVGAAIGKKWSTGQVMVAYEHVFRSNLNGDDRSFFRSDQMARGGNDYRVTRCNPGTITAGGVTYAIPAGGLTPANASSLVAGTTNKCDDLVGQDLFPQQKYDSVNATFTQDVTDWLTLFADGFWSKRDYIRQPAFANATLTVPSTNAFFVRPAGFTGSSYTVAYNFMKDLPRNTQTGFARNWEVSPGVRVKLPAGFTFEALFTYGKGNDQANQYRGINNAALNAALASSDPAVAFDPYGLGRTSATTLANISNQISLSPTLNTFKGYEARLNGALFSLPGGDVKLAAGYEGQDMDTRLGIARGNPGTPVTYRRFKRHVDSAYAELLLPIFGPQNETAGFNRLEIDAAIRYDRYDDVGHTTNPKIGVNWAPVSGLTFRGSYGTSFRAPLISQIYGNSNSLFVQSYQNPAGGAPLTGVALSGPNLGLKPETATTWSLGADWDGISNLRLSLTYFNIKYTNQVDTYLADLAILSRESQFAGTGIILRGADAAARVCQLIAGGTSVTGALPGGNCNNVTLFVDGRNNNLGQSRTEGIDFVANYRLATDRVGDFAFNLSGTYMTRFSAAVSPAATPVDRLNTIFNPLRFKARGSVTWDIGNVRSQLTLTHVGGYLNNAVKPSQKVASYNPVDLSVAWNIGGENGGGLLSNLVLGAEVRNLFDEKPPYVNIAPGGNGNGGYDATVTNPIGRMFAVSLRKSW